MGLFKTAGFAHTFQASEKYIQQFTVGVHVTLQRTELKLLAVEILYFLSSGLPVFVELRLAPCSRLKLALNTRHHLAHFGDQVGFCRIEALGGSNDLGVFQPIDLAQLSQISFGGILLKLHVADQYVVQHRRDTQQVINLSARRAAQGLHVIADVLCRNTRTSRVFQARVEGRQLIAAKARLAFYVDQAFAHSEVLQRLF